MRIRIPRRPRKTPRPKKTIVQAMKDASKVLPKKGQTPPKNVFTGQTKPTRISPITGKPVKRKSTGITTPQVKKRKVTGTPTPNPRAIADARRMSPNVDTRMKQLSIDRGRTKGVKSSVMDKSLGIDARMAALAKERRAKGQYKSRSRAALDAARKKAIATARNRVRATAALKGLGNRAVKGSSLNRNVRGLRQFVGARVGRKRRSRI